MSLEEWVGVGIPDEIVEQAISWVTLLDSDNSTLEQQVEFYEWLEEDNIHQWAFEELSAFWAKSQLSKEHIDILDKNSHGNINTISLMQNTTPQPEPKFPLYEISAVILICIGLVIGIVY